MYKWRDEMHKERINIGKAVEEFRKVQEILLGSTEAQAVFMADMVEAMARNIKMVVM